MVARGFTARPDCLVSGMRLASTDRSGWAVENIGLVPTGRHSVDRRISAEPLGGSQLMVSRFRRIVPFCADVEGRLR